MARNEPISLSKAFLELGDKLLVQAREPNILAYEPTFKQGFFHKADNYLRLYIGGNRSGKSYATVVEDIWWATGTHPFIDTPPPPIRGRVVAVDLLQGVGQIIVPLFKRLCPPAMLKGGSWEKAYSTYERTLTFANGSTIEFMSYEMKTEKFAGTSRHFVHFDEEPPKNVYDECMARIIDTEGSAWISMTPVEGMTWLYDSIYEPVRTSPEKKVLHSDEENGSVYSCPTLDTAVIEVSSYENTHLSEKALTRYFSTQDEADREARSRGQFLQKSGKVFKTFSENTHVIPPVDNPRATFKGWAIYTSVDHGWNNPTAWLWHAVSPKGLVITFAEHYKSEMTIMEHSTVVLGKEAVWRIDPDYRTGDPAIKQTSGITGTSVLQEYAKHGVYISVDSVPREIEIGLEKMQQYFRLNEQGKPGWFITEDCPNFIREIKGLHYKKFVSKKAEYDNNKKEEVQKKDDHTYDSARYFATALPDLTPDVPVPTVQELPRHLDYDEALWLAVRNEEHYRNETTWQVVEEY